MTSPTDKRFVTVYRSARVTDLYLFTERGADLDELPEELRRRLGGLTLALEFVLTADRSLARSDPEVVRAALDEQGFYLQMPPAAPDASSS